MEVRNSFFKSDFKTREHEEKKIIEGYFIVYNQEIELWSGYHEKIAPGACKKAISENDIRALFNHDFSVVLGRNKASTLRLFDEDYGVRGVIEVNENDTQAMDIYERVKRGDISGCSFGFYPTRTEYKDRDDGILETIIEADVLEISICTFPAYPQTEIYSRKQQFTQDQSRKILLKKEKLKERFKCL